MTTIKEEIRIFLQSYMERLKEDLKMQESAAEGLGGMTAADRARKIQMDIIRLERVIESMDDE